MKKKIAALFSALLLFMIPLCPLSFAEESGNQEDVYEQFKGKNISINVYNWGEYVSDGSDDSLDVNKAFEERTGIRVNYTTFATNEELYAKLKSGGADYDIIIPSDYMISRMLEEDMLLPLDYANIPNASNLMERFQSMSYDPKNAHSVPYTWGTVGIFYNKEAVQERVDSWAILWDEKYKGDILMFSNSRDAFGIAQKMLGQSYNNTDLAEWDAAYELLVAQKPVVQMYVMDEIFDKMANEEAIIAPYYSGDYAVLLESNENIAFAYPKEGTNLFVDAMCIPEGSKQKAAAELYINFMLEPDVGLANIDYIGYATPNEKVYELLDPEIQDDPYLYPSEEILENTEVYENLPNNVNQYIGELWNKLLNSSGNSDTPLWVMPSILLGATTLVIFNNIRRKNKKKQEFY